MKVITYDVGIFKNDDNAAWYVRHIYRPDNGLRRTAFYAELTEHQARVLESVIRSTIEC